MIILTLRYSGRIQTAC